MGVVGLVVLVLLVFVLELIGEVSRSTLGEVLGGVLVLVRLVKVVLARGESAPSDSSVMSASVMMTVSASG
jgi:Na+-transporting methylmalonyl-CoA/oxaloacetate decarboxylase gamma subunit